MAAVLCGSQEYVESLQTTVPTECLVPSVLIATQVCEGPPDANSHPPVSWLQVCPIEALWTMICVLLCVTSPPTEHALVLLILLICRLRIRPFPVSSITFLWFTISNAHHCHFTAKESFMPWMSGHSRPGSVWDLWR